MSNILNSTLVIFKGSRFIVPEARWLKTLFLIAVITAGCQPSAKEGHQAPQLRLSLGIYAGPASGLIPIAEEKGYFKQVGIEISIKPYPSGHLALEAMRRGEVQAATVSDRAFSGMMLKDKSIRVIASTGTLAENLVIARRDRGINELSDLRGKKIGFSEGTSSDYLLHSYLIKENISLTEITAVNIPPEKQSESIVNGEVDAVFAFEVQASDAIERLGKNAVLWDVSQMALGFHWLLAANESSTLSPEPLKRFLKALLMAEDFALTNEDEAKEIVCKRFDLNSKSIQRLWPKHRLTITLNQSIIISLKNYVDWTMSKEGKFGENPHIQSFIYTGALEEINPKLVTIFR